MARTIEFYELRKVVIEPPKPGVDQVASQAAIICGLCGETIEFMHGPGDGPICLSCGDLLRRGRLRGRIVRPL